MFNLHARLAFSSSSETETANFLPTQNRTSQVRPQREATPSGVLLKRGGGSGTQKSKSLCAKSGPNQYFPLRNFIVSHRENFLCVFRRRACAAAPRRARTHMRMDSGSRAMHRPSLGPCGSTRVRGVPREDTAGGKTWVSTVTLFPR